MTANDGEIDLPEDGVPLHPVEAPKPSDELYQAFPNEPTAYGIDKDGLPRPVVPHSIEAAKAPPLDPDRFICMADRTRFVLRNGWGDVIWEISPVDVSRSPDGRYRVSWVDLEPFFASSAPLQALVEFVNDSSKRALPKDVDPHELRRIVPNADVVMLSRMCGRPMYSESKDGWVEVEAVRPQCRYYRRQFKDFPDDPAHQHVIRLCTARQTDTGEFLSLGDSEMLACELRDPVYGNEAQKIDDFDDRVVAAGRRAKRDDEEFDIDGALAAEGEQPIVGEPRGGVFGDGEIR